MFRVQFSGDSREQAMEHCSNCMQKLLRYIHVQNPEGNDVNRALLLSQPASNQSESLELEMLLQYRDRPKTNLHKDLLVELHDLGLLRGMGLHSLDSPDTGSRRWRRCKRCVSKQKRGKQAGVRDRQKANPSQPALPSILLSNVRPRTINWTTSDSNKILGGSTESVVRIFLQRHGSLMEFRMLLFSWTGLPCFEQTAMQLSPIRSLMISKQVNVLSWNVRGWNNPIKLGTIKDQELMR
ncbi:uncharacterized protein [Hemitrygon akajei]|uniref:uncharacterized protein n=1 Tax=Hemitrygon akajei TaxID=2704970 RepID=UPI003BF94494